MPERDPVTPKPPLTTEEKDLIAKRGVKVYVPREIYSLVSDYPTYVRERRRTEWFTEMREFGYTRAPAMNLRGKYEVGLLDTSDYIGTEADTLNEVWYIPREKIYREVEEGKTIGEQDILEVTYTASIETEGGHEPFEAEVTATTYVSEQDKEAIDETIKRVDARITDYIREEFDKAKIEKAREEGRVVSPGALLSNKIIKEEPDEYRMKTGTEDIAYTKVEKKRMQEVEYPEEEIEL